MRAVISIVCLLLCGCDSKVSKQEITDSTGANRLALIERQGWAVGDISHDRPLHDFHSLVWQTNAGAKWRDRLVISQAAFQAGRPRTRWVSDIHSFDATNGTAIILTECSVSRSA